MATKKVAKRKALALADQQLAQLRMDAVKVAAGLPQAEHNMNSMSGGYSRPGKTATGVVAEAAIILAFIVAA